MVKPVYRAVATNEEAIALGYNNVQSYRLAVRQEQAREQRLAYADAVGRHQHTMAQKLQQGSGHIMRTSPLTPQQEAVARAQRVERGDGR